MKAADNIRVFVDKAGTPVSHYSGDPLKGKKKIEIKKGDEVPKELLSYFLQYNRDYLDMATATKENLETIHATPEPPPRIVPRKYSQESLTSLINSFGNKKKEALEALRKILEEEFKYKTRSRRIGYMRNKILTLQEKERRGG